MKYYYNIKSVAILFIFLFSSTLSFSQLSGTYTIGTGGNYTTIASAVTALLTDGVNGPVTFNILTGVYEEIITIDSIPGSSAANNITFQSQTGNRDDVLWKDSVDNPPALITLNGTDHLTFKDISFRNGQSFYTQYVFYILSYCDELRFLNNKIMSNGLFQSYGIYCNNVVTKNLLINNNIFEGITGIESVCPLKSMGTVIANNRISNKRGIVVTNQDSLLIEKNEIILSSGFPMVTVTGISLSNCDQHFKISKNNIVAQGQARYSPSFGLGVHSSIGQNSLIVNNFVYYTDGRGILITNSSNIGIYFNTTLSVSNYTYSYATNIQLHKTIQCNVKNNVCGGWNSVLDNDSNLLLSSDHNYFQTFYFPFVPMFFYNDTGYPGLDQYRSASFTDSHSVVNDVFFVSHTDLHLAGSSVGDLSLRGVPIPGITDDIDGDLRDASAPYMGADEADVPLPVELSSFISTVTRRDVCLNWRTSLEINNSGFEIERSAIKSELHQWQSVGFVNGSGTINSPVDYSFNDKDLNSGRYKYRLRQIDFNGNFKYFDLQNEVVVGLPENYFLSQNYPNPFNPTTKINFSIPNSGVVNISMYDINGKEVKTLLHQFKDAGYYNIQFNGSELSSGIYFYSIQTENFAATKKMVLLK